MNIEEEYDTKMLLTLVAELTDAYTSKESSSVSYEVAERLMEAVCYTIEETAADTMENTLVTPMEAGERTRFFYNRGRQLIYEKVMTAKRLYEDLILDFTDYGCANYRDTILKGMPEFFRHYNMKFAPQDHILTLDYPVMMDNRQICGVDLIYDYLRKIRWENHFLSYFDAEGIKALLRLATPEYETLYMDNICQMVLIQAVKCMIADRLVTSLRIEPEDEQVIMQYFNGEKKEQVQEGLARLVMMLVKQMQGVGDGSYFASAIGEHWQQFIF